MCNFCIDYQSTVCHGCDGKGWVPNSLNGKPEVCVICNGTGSINRQGYYIPFVPAWPTWPVRPIWPEWTYPYRPWGEVWTSDGDYTIKYGTITVTYDNDGGVEVKSR
jgi:hypothetical protein